MGNDNPGQAAAEFETRFGQRPGVIVSVPGYLNLMGIYPGGAELPVLGICTGDRVEVAAGSLNQAGVEVTCGGEEVVRFERSGSGAHEGWQSLVAAALRETQDIGPDRGAQLALGGALTTSGAPSLITGVILALNSVWDGATESDAIKSRAIAAAAHAGLDDAPVWFEVLERGQAGMAVLTDGAGSAKLIPLPAGCRLVGTWFQDEPRDGQAAVERIVGARLAAAMIADQVGIDLKPPFRLSDVADIDVAEILADGLPEKISAIEVGHGAGVDVEHLVRLVNGRVDPMVKVPVRKVALHALGEAERVRHAEAALRAGEVEAFGKLLDESHDSLRQELRCTSPAMDRLCAAMRKAGAYGARMAAPGLAVAVAAPGREAGVIEAAAAIAARASLVEASDGWRVVTGG